MRDSKAIVYKDTDGKWLYTIGYVDEGWSIFKGTYKTSRAFSWRGCHYVSYLHRDQALAQLCEMAGKYSWTQTTTWSEG